MESRDQLNVGLSNNVLAVETLGYEIETLRLKSERQAIILTGEAPVGMDIRFIETVAHPTDP